MKYTYIESFILNDHFQFSIPPSSRQIMPDSLSPNSFKQNSVSILVCFIVLFLISGVFPTKIDKNCSNKEICPQAVFLRKSIQARNLAQAEIIACLKIYRYVYCSI